jgi:hypothetical protein
LVLNKDLPGLTGKLAKGLTFMIILSM